MLDSVPSPFQAVLWPLVGAAVVLTLGRFLPTWLRRLLTTIAALASLATLWSLRDGTFEQVELYWTPLNFFRMSPSLLPSGLALLVGLTLAGVTAACLLGIRDSTGQRSTWHALFLVCLAGSLILLMATNLLTLTLGSALIDLALIAMALSSENRAARVVWRFVVPGAGSTLVLFLATLQMDIQVGNASLLVQNTPAETLILLSVAGVLRLLVFPIHPRGLQTPANLATLLLPVGIGIYLLTRVQTIVPILENQSWLLILGGIALLTGGFLARLGRGRTSDRQSEVHDAAGPDLLGIAIHQTGFALSFVVLVASPVPWPLLSLTLALATLAILWDTSFEPATSSSNEWGRWLTQRLEPLRERAGNSPARWRNGGLVRYATALAPAIALASLAGAPFTAGAVGRWSFYAKLLRDGEATLLIVTLIADTVLVSGLWIALGVNLRHSTQRRIPPSAFISMLLLAVTLIVLGVASNAVLANVGLQRLAPAKVSVWGLGFIYLVPWLVGGWLARIGTGWQTYSDLGRRILGLDWLYSSANWVGQRLLSAVGWFGQIGEGEGWWGWTLIILALGAILLILR